MLRDGPIPVFVVGVGRSGTSLLQAILGSNSKVASMPETGFVRRNVVTGNRTVASGDLAYSEFRRLDETLLDRLERFAEHGREARDIHQQILLHYSLQKGAELALDKDPRLIEHIPALRRYYPDSFVIHITRDPRDVLASKKKAAWSRDQPVLRHLFAGYTQLKLGRKNGPKHFGGRYIELRYEELLDKPEQVIRGLCACIGVDFEQPMMDHSQTATTLVADDEMQWKAKVMSAIDKNNSGKWKSTLSNLEISSTEQLFKDSFDETHLARSISPNLGVKVSGWLVASSLKSAAPLYELWRRLSW